MVKKAPFDTCPVFGTPITDVTDQIAATPCGPGGDYYALQDSAGSYYRIPGTVLNSTTKDQLTAASRKCLREWLRGKRESGDECPMITDIEIQRCVEQQGRGVG